MKKFMTVLFLVVAVFWAATATAQQGAGPIAALHPATATAEAGTPAETTAAPTPTTTEQPPDDATAAPDAGEPAATPDAGLLQPDGESDAVEEGDGGEEPEPTVGDIVSGGGEVYDIWKTQGWIAGLTALIYLLIQLTKIGFIKKWLGVRKWLRPLIALVLGLAGSVFAAMQGGVVWWSALLGGIGAALGSSGFNELMNAVTPSGRAKRTGDGK